MQKYINFRAISAVFSHFWAFPPIFSNFLAIFNLRGGTHRTRDHVATFVRARMTHTHRTPYFRRNTGTPPGKICVCTYEDDVNSSLLKLDLASLARFH
jgi:hypothetical protein